MLTFDDPGARAWRYVRIRCTVAQVGLAVDTIDSD